MEKSVFKGYDAVGVKITVGCTCKVIKNPKGLSSFGNRVGDEFIVDILEDIGYVGNMTVSASGGGWTCHNRLLVV